MRQGEDEERGGKEKRRRRSKLFEAKEKASRDRLWGRFNSWPSCSFLVSFLLPLTAAVAASISERLCFAVVEF